MADSEAPSPGVRSDYPSLETRVGWFVAEYDRVSTDKRHYFEATVRMLLDDKDGLREELAEMRDFIAGPSVRSDHSVENSVRMLTSQFYENNRISFEACCRLSDDIIALFHKLFAER